MGRRRRLARDWLGRSRMTAGVGPAHHPRRGGGLTYDERSALVFILPLAGVLLAVAVFPILYSFYISLYSLKLTRPHRVPFIWFDNYIAVLSVRSSGRPCSAPSAFA